MKLPPPIPITPQTKVGDLLRNYPHLEETLIGLSPEFQRLKNPALRATVAKVATLAQVARIGGLDVAGVIHALRRAAGGDESLLVDAMAGESGGPDGAVEKAPSWFDRDRVSATFDARPAIEEGRHPLPDVVRAAEALGPGGILELITPFDPAPLVGVLDGKGFDAWGERRGPQEVRTYFRRR